MNIVRFIPTRLLETFHAIPKNALGLSSIVALSYSCDHNAGSPQERSKKSQESNQGMAGQDRSGELNYLYHPSEQWWMFPADSLDPISQRMYSKILIAAKEPRMFDAGSGEEFRFTWVRSMDPPWVFHVKPNTGGGYSITTTKLKVISSDLEYADSYTVDFAKTFELESSYVDNLRRLVEAADFWKLKTEDGLSGMDGSMWVVEIREGSNYHLVHRYSPEGPFETLGRWFMEAGRMKIPTGEDQYY